MKIVQTRVESPGPSWAVYQLDAVEGESVFMTERVTVGLDAPDPLSDLSAAKARFQARVETVLANMALMP